MSKGLTLLPVIGALWLVAAPARADFVNFEADTTGIKANGFQSVDSPNITFATTAGRQMNLSNFGAQGDGQSLASEPDDPSGKFLFTFSQSYDTLKLSFGNDDPDNSSPGDRAWLNLFLGSTLVGTSSVEMNRNDIMDQSVSFSGAFFDNAEFFYGTSGGTPTKISEIIDDISFSVVPEPTTLSLLAVGLVGVGLRRRRTA